MKFFALLFLSLLPNIVSAGAVGPVIWDNSCTQSNARNIADNACVLDTNSVLPGGSYLPLSGGTMGSGATISWGDGPYINTDTTGNFQLSSTNFNVDNSGNITTSGALNLG